MSLDSSIATSMRFFSMRMFLCCTAMCALALLSSCSSKKPLKIDPSETPSGLEAHVRELNGDAVIVAMAPSVGWQVRYDGQRREQDAHAIFITMTRPNPKYTHAQVVTGHRIGTQIRIGEPMLLYVRVLEYGEDPISSKKLYRPATILDD